MGQNRTTDPGGDPTVSGAVALNQGAPKDEEDLALMFHDV